MRHLVPVFRPWNEFPPERLAMEEAWATCPVHVWRDSEDFDYFIRNMQMCGQCGMPRVRADRTGPICVHVAYELDRENLDGTMQFVVVSHPVDKNSEWDAADAV